MRVHSIYTILLTLPLVFSAPSPKPQTVYDQKQNGGNNFQVHLNDIQIVALLGDDALGDYEYNYDYSDFTIKPSSNVTVKPEEPTTASPSSTENSSTPLTESTETEKATTENVITLATNSPDKIKVQIVEEPMNLNTGIVPAEEVGGAGALPLGEVVHYRRCAVGYTRDKKGRCRRVRRPGSPLQLDISRLASNLAARFRHSSAAEAPGDSTPKE